MNVWNFFLATSYGNFLFQVLLGILGGIIVFPRIRKRWLIILLSALIMEVVIDSAHLINKDLTHNFFFTLQLPLIFFFFGYVFYNKKLMRGSIIFLLNSFAHMISDTAFEGGTITPLYPFSSQTYGWNEGLSFLGIHGAYLGLLILLLVWLSLRVVAIWLDEGRITLFPSPPPARIGKRAGDIVSPPS